MFKSQNSDFCPRCEHTGLMMSLNDGSTTRFCHCGYVFHKCGQHQNIVFGRGPTAMPNPICSCAKYLRCSCQELVAVLQPGVLYCQRCKVHYLWDDRRGLYVEQP